MKKELIILVVIGTLLLIGIRGWQSLTTSGTRLVPLSATTTEYRNEKFSYRFTYPKTWEIKNTSVAPGYVEARPINGKPYVFSFWYKESPKIKDVKELETFVHADASYSNLHEGTKTMQIAAQRVGNLDALAWDYQNSDGTVSRAYYVPDFTPSDDQIIFVWVMVLHSGSDSMSLALADQEVRGILSSYSLLK